MEAATAWGDALPPGEVPEGPLAGPWPAGRGTPNGFGLYDMGTIVHEWCARLARSAVADAPGEPRRLVAPPRALVPAWRPQQPPPGIRYSDYGFRVLQEV